MSDLSQGPGWWQASDGKWYPPEAHPNAQATQPQATTPTAPQPQAVAPTAPQAQFAAPPVPPGPMAPPPGMAPGYAPAGPPPKKKGGKGCLIALVIFLVLIIGGGIAVTRFAGRAFDNAIGKTTCDIVSEQDVSSVLGKKVTLFQTGLLTSPINAVDNPVLYDGTSCIASSDGSSSGSSSAGQLLRVARLQTGDAAGRYQQELTQAKGVKKQVNANTSLESLGYYNKDVSGLGDEAFCTKSGPAGLAGVLVHKGDTLVFVSVSPDFSTTSIDVNISDPNNPKLSTDDSGCEVSQQLARKIIG